MNGVYGLSWRPSKGGEPMTKFATNVEWADVARTAIARLRALCESARRAAGWYSAHTGQIYVPTGYEQLRGQPLTLVEVRAILGIKERGFHNYHLGEIVTPSERTTRDPARTGGRARGRLYEFDSLENYVLGHLPGNFP